MRIALVTYSLQIGGVETFLKLLALYFRDSGHDVDFIETLEKGRWSQAFNDEGYNVIHIIPNPLFSRIHHAKRIAKILKDFDLVILNDSPHAQSILGLLPENTVAIPVLHLSLNSMLHNAVANNSNWDAVSTVSPAVRESLIYYGIDAKRVFCIPNGIMVPKEWPKKDHDFLQSDKIRVIYIGSVNHFHKGVLYLPGIIKKTIASGAEIIVEVVGDGPDMFKLKKDFSAIKKSGNIVFHGPLPNNKTMEILEDADVLIMPSHFEGLPIILLEAMSLGVVPLATRLPGCTDFVVENGINGLLLGKGNEKGFADAISNLAKNRSSLRSLSKSAWETVHNRFSYNQTGAAYLDLAEKCLQRRILGRIPPRSRKIDKALIGDFPWLPTIIVRPVRKILRMVGLFPKPKSEPFLYVPNTK